MGGYYGMLVLVGVTLSLKSIQCDVSCGGTNGQPGVNGDPGRDGLPGVKGEKGEPALMAAGPVDADVLLRLRGEVGSRGSQGDMGPKGYSGNLGAAGYPGTAGRPGPNGRSVGQGQHSHQQTQSAFSVMRTETSYPAYNQIVTYQMTVVNNPGHFNPAMGVFTCRIAGVYYFNFHSAAKVSICLNIASDALTNKLGFCDYNKNYDQVLSGGVVLELTVGQKVWLESFRDQQTATDSQDNREKQIIFNGFLLFSNTE
ncbi:complement C1q subcomponent subunit C-like [Labrus mixtus]|uniref:complement C1q subcomponent subunit C-like n=1 Tax=Labrus mixtus TaxID=508554 RepID=UPI0029C088AC|nr:complement C1q subcomponent subunit C-like [Labrus mixtus]